MVSTLAVATLVEAARRVGVELHEVDTGGNLYVWHTPSPEEAVLYIGKSASDTRLRNEKGWREFDDPKDNVGLGIVTLLRVNHGVVQAFYYDPSAFDSSRWRLVRDQAGWTGPAIDQLDVQLPAGQTISAEEVEKLLVRIAIRYGVPIGNSQFASQWEGPYGTVSDTLAALAVRADPRFVVPPPNALPIEA